MEKRKNLCAMIPETLYTQVCSEKEQLELTLSQYVERILKEHFEGGKAMANGTRTLAFQVSEELFTRIKEHLKKPACVKNKMETTAQAPMIPISFSCQSHRVALDFRLSG